MTESTNQPPTIPTVEYYTNKANRRAWVKVIVERIMMIYSVKRKQS